VCVPVENVDAVGEENNGAVSDDEASVGASAGNGDEDDPMALVASMLDVAVEEGEGSIDMPEEVANNSNQLEEEAVPQSEDIVAMLLSQAGGQNPYSMLEDFNEEDKIAEAVDEDDAHQQERNDASHNGNVNEIMRQMSRKRKADTDNEEFKPPGKRSKPKGLAKWKQMAPRGEVSHYKMQLGVTNESLSL